jgi:zinc transporter 1
MYTYGWQRAETLGALVNGVFLVALCLSIFLEAIQRFVEPSPVSNPKLVLIVGCLGLASNILGLFLFHEHGHGHSHGEEHGHTQAQDPISNAEEGHSHVHGDRQTQVMQDPNGKIADILPQSQLLTPPKSRDFTKSDEDGTTISASTTTPTRKSTLGGGEVHPRHRRRTSGSFGRGFGSVDNIHIHPASFRDSIVQISKLEEQPESENEEDALLDEENSPDETSRIFINGHSSTANKVNSYGSIAKRHSQPRGYSHENHHHNQPKDASDGHGHGGHGHSHGDLNMRGVFLHVLGDALGNIGVIASALIIWLTHFPGRFYFDPGISLVITVIILTSAIPLCKAASRILLQAVPVGMSIEEIRADIEALDGVLEAHHLHVWQLSDTKLVASLHVKVDCEVEGSGSHSYMYLAREIRKCLHAYGIHSSTIQPEFTTGAEQAALLEAINHNHKNDPGSGSGDISPSNPGPGQSSKAGSVAERTCLLDCSDNCDSSNVCCPAPGSTDGNGKGK